MTVVDAIKGLALVEGVLVRAARACVLWWGRGDGVDGGASLSRPAGIINSSLVSVAAAARRGDAIAATRSRTPRRTALARDGRAPPQARLGPPLRDDGLADLLEVVENR